MYQQTADGLVDGDVVVGRIVESLVELCIGQSMLMVTVLTVQSQVEGMGQDVDVTRLSEKLVGQGEVVQ